MSRKSLSQASSFALPLLQSFLTEPLEKSLAKGSITLVDRQPIPLIFCAQKTSRLQPAITTIEEDQVTIYLSPYWKDHPRLVSEFLPHEIVHALRAPLKSLYFEEMAAYSVHPKGYYRILGPLFIHHFEPWIFAALALLLPTLTLFYPILSLSIAVTFLSFWLVRGAILFYLWRRAYKKLGEGVLIAQDRDFFC